MIGFEPFLCNKQEITIKANSNCAICIQSRTLGIMRQTYWLLCVFLLLNMCKKVSCTIYSAFAGSTHRSWWASEGSKSNSMRQCKDIIFSHRTLLQVGVCLHVLAFVHLFVLCASQFHCTIYIIFCIVYVNSCKWNHQAWKVVFNVCHHLRGAWQAESLLDYAILLLAQESYSSRSWNHVGSCPFGMASVTGLTTKIADLGVSRLSKQNVWLLTWALQEKKHEKQIQDRNHMHHLLGTSLREEHCIWNCCGIDGITTRVFLPWSDLLSRITNSTHGNGTRDITLQDLHILPGHVPTKNGWGNS